MAPEEQARANLYGLLARLFYAPPDAALLQGIAAEKMEGELAAEWDALARAAAAADAELLRMIAAAGDLDAEDDRLAAAWRELRQAAVSADVSSSSHR